jgi:hypothetical protein
MNNGNINIYYIFYGTHFTQQGSYGTQALLDNFGEYIGTSPYFAGATTYYDNNNVPIKNAAGWLGWLGGNYQDVFVTPTKTQLVDSDVANIVTSQLGHHFPIDANGVYFVIADYTISETSTSGQLWSQFGGWHTHLSYQGTDIKYAFIGDASTRTDAWNPFASGAYASPNGNIQADLMVGTMAHELIETVVDADTVALASSYPGWSVFDASGATEIMDYCEDTFSHTYGPNYYYTVGSTHYLANTSIGGFARLLPQYVVNFYSPQTTDGCTSRLPAVFNPTGDFDGDHFDDYADYVPSTGTLTAYRNLHNGSYSGAGQSISTAATGCTPQTHCVLMVADFTGDHLTDYATRDTTTGTFQIFKNMGPGTPGHPTGFQLLPDWGGTTCSGNCDVLVGDFTGDGFADYANVDYPSRTFKVFPNLQNGNFATSPWPTQQIQLVRPIELDIRTFLVGDFNGDGAADVLVVYDNGTQTFESTLLQANPTQQAFALIGWNSAVTDDENPYDLVSGDADGDGWTDIGYHIPGGLLSGSFSFYRNTHGYQFNMAGSITSGTGCAGANCRMIGAPYE